MFSVLRVITLVAVGSRCVNGGLLADLASGFGGGAQGYSQGGHTHGDSFQATGPLGSISWNNIDSGGGVRGGGMGGYGGYNGGIGAGIGPVMGGGMGIGMPMMGGPMMGGPMMGYGGLGRYLRH